MKFFFEFLANKIAKKVNRGDPMKFFAEHFFLVRWLPPPDQNSGTTVLSIADPRNFYRIYARALRRL